MKQRVVGVVVQFCKALLLYQKEAMGRDSELRSGGSLGRQCRRRRRPRAAYVTETDGPRQQKPRQYREAVADCVNWIEEG